ncbi:MAG: 7TM-DISM domain-containing protein [Lautropia sp.]
MILIGCWLWCGLFQGSPLLAQPVIELDRHAGVLPLAGRLEWLHDEGARWQPSEAAAAAGWQRLAGSPNAGFTADAIWLRFEVNQPADAASWWLEIDNALLEDIRLVQRDAGGDWRIQRAGRAIPHSDWPLDTRSPVFRLDLPPGPHVFMLRVATRNSLSTSLSLWNVERYYAHARNEALLWGFYFGLYALVILIQFLFWYWTREALSGWYVLYAGLNCLAMMMTMGYLQNALDLSGNLAVMLPSLMICASIYAGTKFTVVVLDLDRFMPRLNRFLLRGAATAAVATSLLVLIGAVSTGTLAAQVVSIVWILILTGATIALLRRHGAVAERFLLAAFGVFFVGILIRYLRNLGWLQPGPLTDHSVQVASVLHMITMCVFIVYRYNALQTALQVEQAARREQRDFVALVSHEFRTPLAIIDTSVRQLAAHLDAPFERSRKRCVNIQAAVRRMTDLMDRYLTVERLAHAERTMQTRPCDLQALLEGLAAEGPEGRLRLRVRDLPADFIGDPDMLRVAMRNLISNADRHARPDTPVELSAFGLRDGSVSLRVTNEGDAIAADELPLLFQKYYRGRAGRGKPGAGLGLYLVQQIVNAHGGRIVVRSASGLTSFRIWLPGAGGGGAVASGRKGR